MNSLVVVAVLALAAAQAQANFVHRKLQVEPEDRIVGGGVVERGAHPYQVYLDITDVFGGKRRCGGSLMTVGVVLTSASCVNDAITINAYLGVRDVNEEEPTKQGRKVVVITTHKNYNYKTHDNDIALLWLLYPIMVTDYAQVIKLPKKADAGKTYVGEIGTVAGWGRVSDSITKPSNLLKDFSATIISNADCKKDHSYITPRQICVEGDAKKATCEGDWGGPLVIGAGKNRVQVGIVTKENPGGCQQGTDGLYTRVSEYLDWIAEAMVSYSN